MIRGDPDVFLPLLKQARKAVAAPMSGTCSIQQAILETVETSIEMGYSIFDDQPKERLKQLWARVQECDLQEEMGFWYIVLIANYGGTLNYEEGTQKIADVLPMVQQFKDPWNLGYGYLLASRSQWRNPETCKSYLSIALENFTKIGVMQEQGITLQVLGNLAASEFEYGLAIEYTKNAQRLFTQVGDELGVDSTWTNLGEYYLYSGKIDQAFHAFAEQRRYSEKTGNRRILGTDLSWESLQASRYRELDYAMELRKRSLEIAIEVGNQNDIAWHTWEMGEIYRLMGDLTHARKYFQEAYPVFELIQEVTGLGFYHRGMGDIAMMEGNLEGARVKYEQALGFHRQELRGNRPWGLALTHARLGAVLVKLGAFNEAKPHFRSSLSYAIQWHNPDIKTLPLIGIAGLLVATGHPGEALEVAACVASKPTTWNEVKKQAGEIMAAARQGLSTEEARLCQETGEGLELDELCQRYMDSLGLAG
jgi:tetratricopeptide (TPR) repeat protein